MKVMFYSLNAAIWPHALPESRLVRELTGRGCEAVYVSCGKTFPVHCTSYSASAMPTDAPRAAKDKVCQSCTRNAKTLAESNGARHLVLKNFLTTEDEARIDELMARVTRGNFLDFRFEYVDVGRATAYELFLLFKKMSTSLNDDEWNYYRIYLRNSLQSLIGFSRIFAQEKPDAVFFYSPQYGANGVCATYAVQHGASVYFVEGSSSNSERYKALRVWEWAIHGLVNPALHHWQAVKDKLTVSDARRVTGHFEELLKASSFAVYSAPVSKKFSLRQHFNITAGAKVLLATLSSFDEAYAALIIEKFPARKVKSPVFRDQFEWIQNTIVHLGGRDDLFLIIRVHPRDYPNKRDPRQSEQAALWEQMFANLPANVIINWPQDGISLYNMLPQVDAVITGWSATGTEALVFGVPVITYDRFLPSYPPDIHFTGESEAEYYANIEKALARGHDHDLAANAWRWLAVSFSMGTVQIAPPIALIGVSWPYNFFFRVLRKLMNLVLKNALLRWDLQRGFTTRQDADRFYDLVTRRDASLYEGIERAALADDPAAVTEAIATETQRLYAMTGAARG
jgi:hypothetical protein